MWLFAAFVAVPIIEIALFIQVGGAIGLWPTLAIVILTAIVGTYLVRTQGLLALNQISRSFNELRNPAEPLAHGAMILVAGALLLTPGFFTDGVGFALLLPPVRAMVYRYLSSRMTAGEVRFQSGFRPPHDPNVIDGEYEEVKPRNTSGASGWTKH